MRTSGLGPTDATGQQPYPLDISSAATACESWHPLKPSKTYETGAKSALNPTCPVSAAMLTQAHAVFQTGMAVSMYLRY